MKLIPITLALLFLFAIASVHAEVYPSPTDAKPLAIGTQAPGFTAQRVNGHPSHFSPTRLSRPQVLIFYRGGWCPYCNTQLGDLHTVEPQLRKSGFDVFFLSTDLASLLYSSPKDKNLPYRLLSDSELKAAEAMHIAYHVDDATYAKLISYGINLEQTTGNRLHELPVPSVFIIDAKGFIRYVYSNPDYTVRLSADAIWAAAQSLLPHRKNVTALQ